MKSKIINLYNLLKFCPYSNRKKINLNEVNRVLFLHVGNSGIGDVIMSLPTLKALNDFFCNDNVDVVYPKEVSFLFKYYDLNKIYYKENKGFDINLIKKLRKKKYDLIITNHPVSSFYASFLRYDYIIGILWDLFDDYGRTIQANFKNHKKITQLTDDRIGKNLLLLYSLGIIDLNKFYEYRESYKNVRKYFLPYFEKIFKKPNCFFNSQKTKIILYFKKWSIFKEEFLINLVNELEKHGDFVFYLIGPSGDSVSIDVKKDNFIKANDLSWEETLYILKNSDIVICEDSSILHFSLLFGKKTIGLFPYHISPYLRVPYEYIKDMVFINSFLEHDSGKVIKEKNVELLKFKEIWIEEIVKRLF